MKAEYLSAGDPDRFKRYKKFEFSFQQFSDLAEHAKRKISSFSYIQTLRAQIFRIPYSRYYEWRQAIMVIPFVQHIAGFGKPLIVSTGLIGMDGVKGVGCD